MRVSGPRRAHESGFTLIELMMVVTIIGILAALAVPRYISYVYKSKTSEAVGFLAEIKARQESYRADFGQYCDVSAGDIANVYPTTAPTNRPRAWDDSTARGQLWSQLGAVPPGRQVLFNYATAAGLPGSVPGWGAGLGYNGSDFWFVSRAVGDLNNDGVTFYMESYSHGQGLYISNAAGWQ